MRADFFATLIDQLAPLADAALKDIPLLQQRADQIASEAVEELCRRSAGLQLGPVARSKQAAERARNGKDAESLYHRAALEYAMGNPDASRDEIVAYLQPPQLSLPPRSAKTIRRYIAGAIDAARLSRAQNVKLPHWPHR